MSTKLKSSVFPKKNLLHTLTILVISGILFVSFPLIRNRYEVDADLISRHLSEEEAEISLDDRLPVFHGNTLMPFSEIKVKTTPQKQPEKTTIKQEVVVLEMIQTTITGYSSTVDQTNSDPFITASGQWVRDGIVAANFLPFGTQIRIPQAFGDKIFVVKDRMNRRHNNRVDVWFQTRQQALNFGIKYTYIEVVEVQ
jgi:3D (Asp-Asp-Asp) domain-containing protein